MPHRPATVASATQLPRQIKTFVLTAGVVLALAGAGLWLKDGKPSSATGASGTSRAPARTVRIPLQGEDQLSQAAINLSTIVPGGWRYEFEGPSTAKVHFDDGTQGLLSDEFGVKGGMIRFSGPADKEVTVKFYPPR